MSIVKKGLFLAAIIMLVLLIGIGSQSIGITSAKNNNKSSNDDKVTFSVDLKGGKIPKNPKSTIELVCGDTTAAKGNLTPGNKSITKKHSVVGELCEIRIDAKKNEIIGDEVTFTISQDGEVLAQKVTYPKGKKAISTDFTVPNGEIEVNVTHEFINGEIGTELRVMSWNIWGGGREAGGNENVEQLIEYISEADPDVLFTIETYQSGEKILDGLNARLPEDRQYHAFKVTRQEVHQPENDNLWIYSRYPIVEEYPVAHYSGLMNDFHFGGGKIALPNGQQVNVFNTWIYHEDWAWGHTNTTVGEIKYGLPRTYTNAEVVATDLVRRIKHIRTILNETIPAYLKDDSSPIIMAGDFNTLSHEDWSERFADAPGHEGLVLQWPVTQLMEEAGFQDSYRWAYPDAGRFPGNTWSPYHGNGLAPGRIDYIWTSGEQMRILDSTVLDKRLPEHQNEEHPFYSDHAAVVTDMMIRDIENLPQPEEPEIKYVPQDQMKATSTSEHVGYEASKAIDGNLKTFWHSEWDPRPPLPQAITLDLGDTYDVTGLSYQTRADFKPDGIITEYNIYASTDGEKFAKVASGTWEEDYALKIAEFEASDVRYIRLEAIASSGLVASAADIKIHRK
ncbi:discoidin domain-containing protein [Bacillus niameyensis]|uniref:discoidin domain-containing protein n=1 Tax=Bacillus niameyensis TaxID=1522308 RepID=UPI000781FFA4|nr:endonuclease/exonuclease/phosphatase family protein [Bacillus niameyensis]